MAFTKIAGPGILSTTDTAVGHGTYTGNLQVDGNISCAGTISYQDVSNIDSVGIVTAQAGIHFGIGATVGKVDADTGITTFSSIGIGNSIYHLEDTNNGLTFGTDTLSVKTAGSERLKILSGGGIGIGESIYHLGDLDTQIFFGTNSVTVKTGGQNNVGIGTSVTTLTSPTGYNTIAKFQHQGNSGYGNIILDRTVNAFIIDNDPTNASSNQSYFSVKNKGTENLHIAHDGKIGIGEADPDSLLHLKSASSPTIHLEDTTQTTKLKLYAQDSSAVVGTYSNHPLIFTTNSAAERLRILSTGQVAIGTAIEGHEDADDLTVSSSGRTGITIRSADDEYGNIFFSDATSGSAEHQGIFQYYHTDDAFIWKSGSSADERLRITSDGVTAINKSSGSYSGTLHVAKRSGINTAITIEGSPGEIEWRYQDGAAARRGGIQWNAGGEVKFDAGISGNSYYYRFDTNGTERLRINSTGAVVIRHNGATASDGYAGLEVRANKDKYQLVLASNSAAASTNKATLGFKVHNSGQEERVKAAIIVQGDGGAYGEVDYMSFCLDNVADNGNAAADADEKLRISSDGHSYLAGRQYLARSGAEPVAGASNLRETFFQAIDASGSHTFQISNVYGGGLVYVVGSRYANANVQTTQIFAIAIRTTNNAHLSAAISSVNGQSGSFSFTVTGASKGITVTNNDSTYSCNCFVTFDVTGFTP